MKDYIKLDEWKILEDGFDPALNRVSESLFSIGNGKIGQRANFEETYSGDTLQGSYVAGVYYPDKTRVGWWKNGYPEYFAKVANATSWIGLTIHINNHQLDLSTCRVLNFQRELNMREGYLKRTFRAELPDGLIVSVSSTRFCSLSEPDLSAISYTIEAETGDADIQVESYLDGDIRNEDANYDEKFWDRVSEWCGEDACSVINRTRKTEFTVASGLVTRFILNGNPLQAEKLSHETREKYASVTARFRVKAGDRLTIQKFVSTLSSLDHPENEVGDFCVSRARYAAATGFETLLKDQATAWAHRWDEADIRIEGDVAAQQAIRFNIFQLYQTYTGVDARLNIGPKGFTGEKYGGSTYWDTEAYCLPFYQATAPEVVAENLLLYRYKHLQKAIENAEKLGFKNGAALYPMVTMNGEECHNEWEITFEEIHRNGAIAYAIYDYIRYTGNERYLMPFGLEVLTGISRFWAQRVNYSANLNRFVILGVTGPNEFENNVNNNWYTNKIASWCLKYTLDCIARVSESAPSEWEALKQRLNLTEEETGRWLEIAEKMHFPFDENHNVFLQQDGFLDKEQLSVQDIPKGQRPIVEHWSWDRILRSIYIKQADVLQGIYFFEDEYDTETIQRHFDFYEPKTVHESSLSPCVHSILAARIGNREKAYEFYLRTARLDLNDYNNDTRDGLHITSMAGTWLSIVKGFAGMRVVNDTLEFTPFLPEHWKGFSFRIRFRGAILSVQVTQNRTTVERLEGPEVLVKINNDNEKKGAVAL